MQLHDANAVSMWNCVNSEKRENVFMQLSRLHEIMEMRFSGVLFRNSLDYIFSHALLPNESNSRLVNSNFRQIMPRTESAQNYLKNNGGFNSARKNLKVEHITSVKTLGLSFQDRDFVFVCENFNVCIVSNDEYEILGKGCGHERYLKNNIRLIVPRTEMIKSV